MKRFGLLSVIVIMLCKLAFATHQRAGEITYKWLWGYTYEVTIITYTYTLSPADRPTLTLNWGDGTTDEIERTEKIDLPNDISKNTYTYNGYGTGGRHTYPGAGNFTLSVEDPNRNAGILNIPNSVNVPLYIETELIINPFLGNNSSPILLNPPLDNACVNEIFIHNPWAYDPDGDSLSYVIDTCKGAGGLDIPGFTQPAASNYIDLDPVTGDLVWNTPIYNGEYNVAIRIEEWRKGYKIGSVLRDMQITVIACDNNPPQISTLIDTCVLAGTLINIPVTAIDPDMDVVTLTGNGTPLLLDNSPAEFDQPVYSTGSVSSDFIWQTECSHVRKLPYQMNFKAQDNSIPVNLVDFASLQITVVAPAPQNLVANPVGININLSWKKSICTNAVGYKIYRRNGYYGFIPDNCETGVPSYTGYSKIADITDIDDTLYTDNNNGTGLIHGNDYCYMVIAYFSDGAESYASNEACAILKKDIPVITNVSVNTTDVSSGENFIAWSKPTELDTIAAPGPHKYLIYQAIHLLGGSFVLIDSLTGLNDTLFTHNILNTNDYPNRYRIDLWNDTPGNRFFIGSSHFASSVFLTLTPSDNKLTLSWTFDVPWTNESYTVLRQDPVSLLYDSIGVTSDTVYIDDNLINGVSYCYKIKSRGDYSATGYASPLINYSQEICGIPVDNEPPCAPVLLVTADCDAIENFVTWRNPNNYCLCDDVVGYSLYFATNEDNDFVLIYQTDNPEDTSFIHTGMSTITGCYAVTAVDSFANVSPSSNIECVDIDICDLYTLPNVFTPNTDGTNDYFIPFPYNFVDEIDLIIFNRWGKIVFKTTDPDIMWDGKCQTTGQECADGVYYYVCDVFEQRLEGVEKRTITGFLHLLR